MKECIEQMLEKEEVDDRMKKRIEQMLEKALNIINHQTYY